MALLTVLLKKRDFVGMLRKLWAQKSPLGFIFIGFAGYYGFLLNLLLVEPAGVEPASVSHPLKSLHV